jgi:signal peptidase II
MVWYKIKFKPQGKVINTSLCLLLSGALGNMIDRIFLGYVVDMLEVTFIDYPVFNVADCFVVAGAILLCIYILFIYKEPDDK